jgi:hypothetical protein
MQIKPKVFWFTAAFLLLGAAPFYVVVVACFWVILDSIFPALFANWPQDTVIWRGWRMSYLVAMAALFLYGLVGLSRLIQKSLPVLARSRKEEL